MRRMIFTTLVLIVATSVGLSGVVLGGSAEPPSYPAADYRDGIDRMGTAEAISFFQGRADRGHYDPLTLTALGRLHLTRSREIGDSAELDKAEQVLGQALALRPDHPGALLASSAALQAQHRFQEALSLAQKAHEIAPSAGTLTVIGDTLSALGDYSGAELAYGEAAADYGDEAVLSGLALLAEVRGRPDEAVRLLERAAAGSLEAHLAGEAAAWYQQRLANLHLEQGDLDEAERRYEAAWQLFPDSHDAPAGLGAVEAARGNLDRAIELTEVAIAVSAQPDLLIAAGDLYLAVGRPALAEERFTAAISGLKAWDIRAVARELAIFYVEHDREPEEALRLAQQDFALRQDLHGYETLAWALYRAGQFEQALELSDVALSFGIRDAALRYQAGLIALALGEPDRAIVELETALAINPEWHVLLADDARHVLAGLDS